MLLSHKKEWDWVVYRDTELESVIQSEVSQKEKNKYHILTRNVESEKMIQMNLFAGQE